MQQALMEKFQQRMASAVDATKSEVLLKAWMPMAPHQPGRQFVEPR
jgi:hypothetical protein